MNNKIKEIYIDTVGKEETYEKYLKNRVISKGIKYTINKKADSKYIVVGAASICAKVIRDYVLERLLIQYNEENGIKSEKLASGYPGGKKKLKEDE